MPMYETDFSMLGRIGAYRLHALRSASETTRAARAAFMAKFEDEVDPERVLDPADRAARASAAMKVYMLRLSLQERAGPAGAGCPRSPPVPEELTRSGGARSIGPRSRVNQQRLPTWHLA